MRDVDRVYGGDDLAGVEARAASARRACRRGRRCKQSDDARSACAAQRPQGDDGRSAGLGGRFHRGTGLRLSGGAQPGRANPDISRNHRCFQVPDRRTARAAGRNGGRIRTRAESAPGCPFWSYPCEWLRNRRNFRMVFHSSGLALIERFTDCFVSASSACSRPSAVIGRELSNRGSGLHQDTL